MVAKKNGLARGAVLGGMLCLSILCGIGAAPAPALAAGLDVSGTDHAYPGEASDGSVDILAVSGSKGDTVYIDVTRGGETLASHLAFTLDDANAEADANGDMVGVVSVDFGTGALSYEDTYHVRVYDDREETRLLYEGDISTAFASFGDGDVAPLMVRTLAAGESRPASIPDTLEHDGAPYSLRSRDARQEGGHAVYDYDPAKDAPKSVEGRISYYDAQDPTGDPLLVETTELGFGESRDMPVSAIVAGQDGTLYRSLLPADSIRLAYPGTTERTIMCQRLDDGWGEQGSFFEARIRYVGEDGEDIGGIVDRVIVNKRFLYTPPHNVYVSGANGTEAYELAPDNDALNADGVLELVPGQASGTASFDIAYRKVPDTAERTWTVVLENGSVPANDERRVIKRVDYRGEPGKEARHVTEKQIDVDGTTYVPANAKDEYAHVFGAADEGNEQVIYYVPDGYVAPEPYEITVNYVNIATNEVIATQTPAPVASPSMRSDMEIASPETFSANGVEWVRLDGQEQPIRHGFYSPNRAYAIYYRDVNDDLHAATVIRTVRVTYVDEEGNTVTRPATIVDGGTTTTTTTAPGGQAPGDQGAAGATTESGTGAAPGADAVTTTGLPTGQDLLAIDGDTENGGDDGLVTGDGTDMATRRIDDDETPLAGPGSASQSAVPNVAVAGGIAGAVAAALLLLFFVRRRKGAKEDPADDNQASA